VPDEKGLGGSEGSEPPRLSPAYSFS
jgi:hypothetical protein